MNEEKEFILAGVRVKAVLSDGGGFYTVTLPSGEEVRCKAEVFETVAVEVKD